MVHVPKYWLSHLRPGLWEIRIGLHSFPRYKKKKQPCTDSFFFQFIILTNYESVLMSQYWLSSHALKQTFHGCGVMEGFRFWWRLIGAVIYRNVLPYPKYILEIGQETERNSGIKLLNVLTVLVLSLLDYVARGWVWVRGTCPLTSHRWFFFFFFVSEEGRWDVFKAALLNDHSAMNMECVWTTTFLWGIQKRAGEGKGA